MKKKGGNQLKLVFNARFNGDKLIKLWLNDKNVILILDLLMDLIGFFMGPFDGSDV